VIEWWRGPACPGAPARSGESNGVLAASLLAPALGVVVGRAAGAGRSGSGPVAGRRSASWRQAAECCVEHRWRFGRRHRYDPAAVGARNFGAWTFWKYVSLRPGRLSPSASWAASLLLVLPGNPGARRFTASAAALARLAAPRRGTPVELAGRGEGCAWRADQALGRAGPSLARAGLLAAGQTSERSGGRWEGQPAGLLPHRFAARRRTLAAGDFWPGKQAAGRRDGALGPACWPCCPCF